MEAGRLANWLLVLMFMCGLKLAHAQDNPICYISNGKLVVDIPSEYSQRGLDSLIADFDLNGPELRQALATGRWDYFKQNGWRVKTHRSGMVRLKRNFYSNRGNVEDWFSMMFVKADYNPFQPGIPYMDKPYGQNRFNRRTSVWQTSDSTALFVLHDFKDASEVILSGSFNGWKTSEERFQRSDSGWILERKLRPGKHLYKFIVDGAWKSDPQNLLQETDGYLGKNSIYFQSNTQFELKGFTDRPVFYLSGDFCGWKEREIPMEKTQEGWKVKIYLADGTYQYKFTSNAFWVEDPDNPLRVNDLNGGFNSLIEKGVPVKFRLNGYESARSVAVSGSFIDWNNKGIPMKRSGGGWEVTYVPGRGTHYYKFIVDGRWIVDPASDDSIHDGMGNWNSYLVHQPNYAFTLKGFSEAKQVLLSGTFNNWSESGFRMYREGDVWKILLYLPPGKHLYKFIIDGVWTLDPGNPIWEDNEVGTGNSILWMQDY